MRLTEKTITNAVAEAAGEDVLPLVKAFKKKKNVSEFRLAQLMKKEVNTTRNMLYRLYESNLVSFIRKKDKKKGWYIYYWTFNVKRVKHLITSLNKKRLAMLEERLKREKAEQFFICKDSCIRLDFEQAVNFEFRCPECGRLLAQEDNIKKIQKIQKEIIGLKGKLKKA